MKLEQDAELVERAAVHAALGDPARLWIVETLSLGDASPSDLAEASGMASNLLAHHLKVLEAAGLVSRCRSEGDRRRTYLCLSRRRLDGLDATVAVAPERIVFVCTANSARSQLAAALWRRSSPVPATSAGTRPAARIDPGAIDVARRHSLPLPRVRPRCLDDVLADSDLVVTVCDRAHEEPGQPGGLHWSIPDPVREGTPAAFDAAFAVLSARVADLAGRLPAA
ncbi:MAG: ArsR family transcriptional regulator [Nocardioides sp.]